MSTADTQLPLYPFSNATLGMVDAPPESAFDNLTRLATSVLSVPVALVSIVEFENDRQYFKSLQGLPEPWATERQTPLSHSFCQHVVKNNAPLAVENAREHPVVCNNLAVRDINVITYLGVPIYDPNEVPMGALCVIDSEPRHWYDTDITTLKQLARCVSDAIKLKAAVKTGEAIRAEQNAFAYAISHDLKSPANTLQLLLDEFDKLHRSKLDKDGCDLLDLSQETVVRMTGQIDDVLAFTRTIGVNCENEPVDLNELMQTVRDDLKAEIEHAGAILTIGPLPRVLGARVQLRSLLQNLISNAIKYRRPETPPVVNVSAQSNKNYVSITVADNGIGIAPEYHDRIFKMFHRLHVRDEYPGTGLGLSLCQQIANRHGGQVSVESSDGQGSTFTVELPLRLLCPVA